MKLNKMCHDLLTENIENKKKPIVLPKKEEMPAANVTNSIHGHVNKASWNILFYPHNDIINSGVNLICTFQDLLSLGQYQIANTPYKAHCGQFWSILLVTDKPYDEIVSALLLIMDFCRINKIADFNVFEPSEIEKINKSLNAEAPMGHVNGSECIHPAFSESDNSLNEINADFINN